MNEVSFAALTLAAFLSQIHGATVYYDDFNNPDDVATPTGLGGDSPTVSSGLFGGISSATWLATTDGYWGSNGSKGFGTVNAFLPVAIPGDTSGIIYTLSVDVSVAASSGYDWLAVGFATTTSGVYWGLGAPWALLRGQTTAGGGAGLNATPNTVQAYAKNEENGVNMTPSLGAPDEVGPYAGSFKIVIDTSTAYWQVAWSFKEEGSPSYVDFHTHQFSASDPNPEITHVGIGAVNNGAGSMDNFLLTAVPEPSSHLMAGCFFLLVLTHRRRVVAK